MDSLQRVERFRLAQAAEAEHHGDAWQRLRVGPLAHVSSLDDYKHWLESYNRFVLSRFGFGPSFFRDRTVLEVGSGPYGIVECLPARRRLAVDPLMSTFTSFMQPHWQAPVLRIAGLGERLPVADACADCVFVVNCLDHALDPARIVADIARCLKPGGFLLLSNNVKSLAGVWLSRWGERFRVRRLMEIHHPQALTRRRLETMVARAGFTREGFALVRGHLRVEVKGCSRLNLWKRSVIGEQCYHGFFVRS